jgi:2-polyprenyl-3-methyl-5-hydroxy-6-metoxy-1,4-benzoquinol methylase
MKNQVTEIKECLACGESDLVSILDLNDQPLANAFKQESQDSEPYFPLAVNMCSNCHHLQLTHAVDPALIYKHYLYVSGTSKTYLHYMHWYAKFTEEVFMTHAKRLPETVLDIGCNDGSQLNFFADDGLKTIGVDPAENLYPVSTRSGHHVVMDFWNKNAQNSVAQAAGIRGIDIITSQNAFAHIPDPLGYLQLVRDVMHEDSLMFISTSQADMVLNNEFDTIYHEHISFFNVKSMQALAERAGLYLIDTIKTPIHGVSYIFILSKRPRTQRVKNIIAMERMQGLYTDETYAAWAANTLKLVADLKVFVELYRNKGYVLGGYGAAAKGNTLLNFSKIKLDFIIDDNELKQNHYSPGMSIPVVPIEHLEQYTSDQKILFIPLAWNYFDDIQKKIVSKRNNSNDKFLKYFPKVEIQ